MTKSTIQHKGRQIGPGRFSAIAIGVFSIVAILLWLLLINSNRENQVPNSTASVTPPAIVPAAVTEFLNYQQNNRAEEAMAKDHAYTSDGLRRLATALESLSKRDGIHSAEIEQRIAQLRQQADSIQADPQANTHAATIRAAFIEVADVMTMLQKQRYANLDAQVTQVRRAAEAIDPAQLMLRQKPQVGTFFAQAGEVLRAMTPQS